MRLVRIYRFLATGNLSKLWLMRCTIETSIGHDLRLEGRGARSYKPVRSSCASRPFEGLLHY